MRLDVSVEASGFSRKQAKELEAYMKSVGVDGDGDPEALRGDDVDEEAEDDDENDEEEDHDEDEEADVEDSSSKKTLRDDVEYTTDRLGNTVEVLKSLSVDDKT